LIYFYCFGSTFFRWACAEPPVTGMLRDIDYVTESELIQWVRESIKTRSNILSHGYQGHVYLYENRGRRLILKAPMGWGLGRLIRQAMLRNEYRVYSRLSGVGGIPRCYGLLDGSYLVLEFVDGIPVYKAEIIDRRVFFESLLSVIKQLHKAGVAHADLKKKDNLLVVEGRTPCIIDFGVAIVRKPGLVLLNHYLYNIARKFDFNAWVKLKYEGKYEDISDQDRKYFNRTVIEKVSRWIKDNYLE
jgi:predicted Ser/Thr protein kinase